MLFGLTPRLYGFHTSRFSPYMSSLGYTDGLCVLVTRGRLWIVSAKIHRRRHISLVSKLTCQSICLCARPGSFPESTDETPLEAWARGAQLFILFLCLKGAALWWNEGNLLCIWHFFVWFCKLSISFLGLWTFWTSKLSWRDSNCLDSFNWSLLKCKDTVGMAVIFATVSKCKTFETQRLAVWLQLMTISARSGNMRAPTQNAYKQK